MKRSLKVIKKQIIVALTIVIVLFTQINIVLVIKPKEKVQSNLIMEIKKFDENDNRWRMIIPKINLAADIKDGTEVKTLNSYVGHFVQSSYINGNVCLAAHNRGYQVNYFENVKKLEKGDEIIYEIKNLQLKYIVTSIKIIKDTDVEVIENTKENQITLITCVEDRPELRRCVIGKLKI